MINKPIMIKRDETNCVKTSSGEFLEYISWKENKDFAVGIGIHNKRFPEQGFLVSKKVDEAIILLKGKGSVIIQEDNKEKRFVLEKDAVIFIPRGTPFSFDPDPSMEIFSVTCPAWHPKQQTGLDYRRKESGRLIL